MAKEPLNEHDPAASQAPHDGIPAPTGEANLIDTDYVIGQDNISGSFVFNLDIHTIGMPQAVTQSKSPRKSTSYVPEGFS